MSQDQTTISDTIKKINLIVDEVFTLSPQDRIICLERLIFGFIEDPKKRLIGLLYELNASQTQIAKALGVDASNISRSYPKRGKK